MKATCANCSALNAAEAKYCRACGREFADGPSGSTRPVVDDHETATPLFDQAAPSSGRPVGLMVGAVVAVVALLGAGLVFIAGRGDDDTATADAVTPSAVTPSTVPAQGADTAAPSTIPAATVAITTTPPTTTPPTTLPPTTLPPTTVPPTTVPPTTVPPSTAPPTTLPPTTVPPPTTVAPNIWDTPVLPSPPLPTSGPGSPLIDGAQLPSGVRAVDAHPFLLNAQGLVDALAAGDWATARVLDPSITATDDELATTFAALDRASLILLDAGVAAGSYEMAAVEVLYNGAEEKTAVRCVQFVANGATGAVSRRGAFPITTIDGNVTPEAVRLDAATFAEVRSRCTFATLAAVI